MNKRQRIRRLLLILLGICAGMTVCLTAPTTAQNVPQGYQSDESLQKGMIVRLKPGDGSKVQAATQRDGAAMLGIVVSSSDAAVSLSHTDAKGSEVFVANYGQYDVLVSTQGGTVKIGDYLTISSLAGVAMKAGGSQEFVLGKALKDFDGKSTTEGSATLKTSDGKKTVSLSRVPVEITVAHNPLYSKETVPGVPEFLQKMAQIVTDRPVSAFRIYASTIAAIVSIIVAGCILFAGVRSGMIAIGRNPLAKKTIFRSLIQVTLMALIVFVIGGIAVYLLLKV